MTVKQVLTEGVLSSRCSQESETSTARRLVREADKPVSDVRGPAGEMQPYRPLILKSRGWVLSGQPSCSPSILYKALDSLHPLTSLLNDPAKQGPFSHLTGGTPAPNGKRLPPDGPRRLPQARPLSIGTAKAGPSATGELLLPAPPRQPSETGLNPKTEWAGTQFCRPHTTPRQAVGTGWFINYSSALNTQAQGFSHAFRSSPMGEPV